MCPDCTLEALQTQMNGPLFGPRTEQVGTHIPGPWLGWLILITRVLQNVTWSPRLAYWRLIGFVEVCAEFISSVLGRVLCFASGPAEFFSGCWNIRKAGCHQPGFLRIFPRFRGSGIPGICLACRFLKSCSFPTCEASPGLGKC